MHVTSYNSACLSTTLHRQPITLTRHSCCRPTSSRWHSIGGISRSAPTYHSAGESPAELSDGLKHAMLSAHSKLCAAVKPATQRQPKSQRKQLRVHASEAFCRDVINLPSNKQSEGKAFKVTFLASKGEAKVVDVADNEYLLDAAEAVGIDLPATCRGGICGACVARVVTGEIDSSDIADLSFTLSDEEIAEGMGLLCMSRAKSDMVIETQCDWGYSLGVGAWKGASGLFSAEPDPLMGDKWKEIKQ